MWLIDFLGCGSLVRVCHPDARVLAQSGFYYRHSLDDSLEKSLPAGGTPSRHYRMCSACEIIAGLPEGIKVNVAQALLREVDVEWDTGTLACRLSRNRKSGLERSDKIKEDRRRGCIAEPPASGRSIAWLIETATAVWSEAT
jgi:hypothetical protein